jgi:hypothetical protein
MCLNLQSARLTGSFTPVVAFFFLITCSSCSSKPSNPPILKPEIIKKWTGRWEADEFLGIQAIKISFLEDNGGLAGYQDELTPTPGYRERIYFHDIQASEGDEDTLLFNWKNAGGRPHKLVLTSPTVAAFYLRNGDKWEAGGEYGERCAILHKK